VTRSRRLFVAIYGRGVQRFVEGPLTYLRSALESRRRVPYATAYVWCSPFSPSNRAPIVDDILFRVYLSRKSTSELRVASTIDRRSVVNARDGFPLSRKTVFVVKFNATDAKLTSSRLRIQDYGKPYGRFVVPRLQSFVDYAAVTLYLFFENTKRPNWAVL